MSAKDQHSRKSHALVGDTLRSASQARTAAKGEAIARGSPSATIADFEQLLEVGLHTLHLEFERINRDHLHSALQPPGFALHDGESRLGFWHPSRRVISISLDLLLGDSWDQAVEVLRHEVAHAYTREVLGARGEPPHGPTFRRACQLLDISSRATIRRRGREDDTSGVAARIDELKSRHLALVEMLRDAAQLEHLSLGRSFIRLPAEQYALASALQGLCGVVCLWTTVFDTDRGRWAHRLHINGPTEATVQNASQVHTALDRAMEREWRTFKNIYDWPTRRERTAFACAFLEAVCERYEPSTHPTDDEGSRRAEDLDLGQWLHQRHPVRFEDGESSDRGETEPWALGFFAGSNVQIHTPLPAGSLAKKNRSASNKSVNTGCRP